MCKNKKTPLSWVDYREEKWHTHFMFLAPPPTPIFLLLRSTQSFTSILYFNCWVMYFSSLIQISTYRSTTITGPGMVAQVFLIGKIKRTTLWIHFCCNFYSRRGASGNRKKRNVDNELEVELVSVFSGDQSLAQLSQTTFTPSRKSWHW